MKLTVLVDNRERENWVNEHGLALLIELPCGTLLFDTGTGNALIPNLEKAAVPAERIQQIVLSHGHNDHTGGLRDILLLAPQAELFCGRGVDKERFSRHPGKPVRELTLPENCADALKALQKSRFYTVDDFSEILPGVFLTGAIARNSFEDCGGPFYLDPQGREKDLLSDEIALLTCSGVLIQGCCHAGIINTVEHCRRFHPEISIKTIAGGLHLLHASEERLKKTADYLNTLDLEKMILLHCTGTEAAAYLKKNLRCEVISGGTGDCYEL